MKEKDSRPLESNDLSAISVISTTCPVAFKILSTVSYFNLKPFVSNAMRSPLRTRLSGPKLRRSIKRAAAGPSRHPVQPTIYCSGKLTSSDWDLTLGDCRHSLSISTRPAGEMLKLCLHPEGKSLLVTPVGDDMDRIARPWAICPISSETGPGRNTSLPETARGRNT
jgi:hypothetical protein